MLNFELHSSINPYVDSGNNRKLIKMRTAISEVEFLDGLVEISGKDNCRHRLNKTIISLIAYEIIVEIIEVQSGY